MPIDVPAPDPLILTAKFDPASAQAFQDLRDRHFPIALNIVPAHLTLFHHLPGQDLRTIAAELAADCATVGPVPFRTRGLRFLGRGVAYEIETPLLSALRTRLAARWRERLTRQDAQGFRPHVTVQNKVAPHEARLLFDRLGATHQPLAGTIVGLDLWHYRGGPWEPAAHFSFTAP